MIIGIGGDVGSGKTTLLAHWCETVFREGAVLHANFGIRIPHEEVITIEALKRAARDRQHLFALDEIWTTADSRNSGDQHSNIRFSRFILQARKAGKVGNVAYTLQDFSQLEKRIRVNTALYCYPRVIAWRTSSGITARRTCLADTPHTILAEFCERSGFLYRKYYIVDGAHLLFDTREEIEGAKTSIWETLLKKYADFEGKKAHLEALLYFDDRLSKAEAKMFSDYFFAQKAIAYVKEIKALQPSSASRPASSSAGGSAGAAATSASGCPRR